MKIAGFQKLTLLDYPSKVACIIFTQGCNYKCPYCQNSGLIDHSNEDLIDEEEIFKYLDKRKGIIDGIVISGGEPTIQKDLKDFMKKVKEKGFLIKLDTNGSNPKLVEEIINEKLVDYIAMDIKNVLEEYKDVTDVSPNISNLEKSISIIKNSKIEHEFRTTIIKNIHTTDKILKICDYVDGSKLFLQNFVKSENVLGKYLEPFTEEELKELNERIERYPNVKIRGM